MFIFPIGHDKLIRRLPYLTIVLIGINVLVWIITYPIELHQRKNINSIYNELREVERELLPEYLIEHPGGLSDPAFEERFHKSIEDGEIIDKESEEYKEWQEVYNKFQKSLDNRVFSLLGFKPANFSFLNLISSMFMHASFLHLLFNMLFLWLVGVNIEDHWGRPVFLSLFFIGGIFATFSYALFNMGSSIPLIGASGAISALMGTFAVRFYKTKIRFFYFILLFLRPIWGTFRLYAWFALGFWFTEQLFYALISRGAFTGVAFFAHVGGFVFGLAAGFGMKFLKVEEKYLTGKIEKQIEAVALHPKLEQAFDKIDSGDLDDATTLLKEVLKDEPLNSDARLELARSLFILGKKKESATEYENIISQLYEKGGMEDVYNIYLEVYEKKIEHFFSPKVLFRLGTYLASRNEHRKAVELFSLIAKRYPKDKLAPVALFKTGRIFLQNTGNESLGKGALAFLINNYPDYRNIHEAKTLLITSQNRQKEVTCQEQKQRIK